MPHSPRTLKPSSSFTPRSISGLALWLDASQTGDLYTTDAGPVVAVNDPRDISGCALWLDGADATSMFDATSGGNQVTAGGAIARWQDKSGNGRHFVQSTSTLRPTLTASVRNGRSVVTFDATDDYMVSAASQNIPQPATWIFVYKVPSSIASGWSLVDSATDRVHVYSAGGATITQYTAGGFFTTESTGVTADQWRIGTYHFNGASSLGRKDGLQTATGTTGTNSITGAFYLGSNNGGAATIRSQMAEAILLSGASLADIARVEAYLAAKWGISQVHAPATAASDPVGYWRDRSGNGRHATQATGTNRMTVSATAVGTRRGLAATSTQRLGVSYTCSQPNTVFAVTRGGSAGTSGTVFDCAPGGTRQIVLTNLIDSTVKSWAGTAVVSLGRAADGEVSCTIAGFNGSSSLSAVNGRSLWAAGNPGTNAASPSLVIGNWTDGSFPINGQLAEFGIYSRALTASESVRLMSYLLSKYGATAMPNVANLDAQDWINRVYANGGTVSASTAAAVNQFCLDIENAPGGSLRDRFYRLNLFCGGTSGTAVGLNSCLVPLYRGPVFGGPVFGSATDTNNGPFVGGDYSETGGLNPGATNASKYLETGVPANTLQANNVHLGAGLLTAEDRAGDRNVMGSLAGANALSISARTASASFRAACMTRYGTATDTFGPDVGTSGAFLGVGNIVAAWPTMYRNGSAIGTDATTSANFPSATTIQVFCLNNSGVQPLGHTNSRMGWYSYGQTMTAGQVTLFNNALSAFNTAMGRT